jgi:hypothetical protein
MQALLYGYVGRETCFLLQCECKMKFGDALRYARRLSITGKADKGIAVSASG